MSTTLWPEGYYNTDGLVSAEFIDIKGKDVWKLVFQMTGCPDQKEVFCHMTGGAKAITYQTLAKLGWNGNSDSPTFSNPAAIEQLKLEHYQKSPNEPVRESWKTAAGTTPVPTDRKKQMEAEFRAYAKPSAAPAGRPAAPPPPKTPPATTPPASTKPASAPPPDDDESGDPAVTVANTKEEAWAVWDASMAAAGKQPDTAKWKAVIAEVGAEVGKKPAEFGPAEWTKVAQAGEIPF